MKRCLACGLPFDDAKWVCPACAWQPPIEQGVVALAPELSRSTEGFDPAFFDRLFTLESASFWFRARNRLIVSALNRYFPRARSMLEIGCGTGFVLAGLRQARPGLQLTGTELLAAGVAMAATRIPGAAFLQMDARRIAFDREFDVTGAFDVLEHIEDDEAVIGQMSRALRPGGGLLVTVPQHPSLWSASDAYAHHKRRYTRSDLLTKLDRHGFDVLRCTSFVSLLLPVIALSRLRQRSPARFDPEAEFRIAAPVNALLGAIMTAERTLIRLGISLPWGGSLLVVARSRATQ